MAGKPVIDGGFRLPIGLPEHMQRFVAAFAEIIGGVKPRA
jgi:hypothetical protein